MTHLSVNVLNAFVCISNGRYLRGYIIFSTYGIHRHLHTSSLAVLLHRTVNSCVRYKLEGYC